MITICSLFSPEIVQHQSYGEKADIWAMGCVLYQMCALVPPFYSNNMLSLVNNVSIEKSFNQETINRLGHTNSRNSDFF